MKITAGTIVRTIVLFLALVNQMLSISDRPVLPIEDATVEAIVTNLWTLIAALVSWWKNNSFTDAALRGDELMRKARELNKS